MYTSTYIVYTSSDFHNSNMFSEHLGTHCTLKLWPQPMYKVNQDFNGRQWKRNNSSKSCVKHGEKLIPNGVKCNENVIWVSVLRICIYILYCMELHFEQWQYLTLLIFSTFTSMVYRTVYVMWLSFRINSFKCTCIKRPDLTWRKYSF